MCRFQGGFGILESFCKDDKLKLVVAWKFFVEERCSFGNDIFLKISHFFPAISGENHSRKQGENIMFCSLVLRPDFNHNGRIYFSFLEKLYHM